VTGELEPWCLAYDLQVQVDNDSVQNVWPQSSVLSLQCSQHWER